MVFCNKMLMDLLRDITLWMDYPCMEWMTIGCCRMCQEVELHVQIIQPTARSPPPQNQHPKKLSHILTNNARRPERYIYWLASDDPAAVDETGLPVFRHRRCISALEIEDG
jgi:hypothetical protein